MPEQELKAIQQLDRHSETDEVFILLKGTALLIAGQVSRDDILFECEKMRPDTNCNIPCGIMNNIIKQKDAELIIVEKDKTNKNGYICNKLSGNQKKKLENMISECL